MKIRNCKILSAGILLVFTIGTTACNSGNGEQVYLHNSDTFIENHTSGILDYESISYEEYAGAGVMSMGPHEPLYRGVICLDEQYAREILEDYEWEETDVDFDFIKVDVSGLEGHGIRQSNIRRNWLNPSMSRLIMLYLTERSLCLV